jgi:hypothetical protein
VSSTLGITLISIKSDHRLPPLCSRDSSCRAINLQGLSRRIRASYLSTTTSYRRLISNYASSTVQSSSPHQAVSSELQAHCFLASRLPQISDLGSRSSPIRSAKSDSQPLPCPPSKIPLMSELKRPRCCLLPTLPLDSTDLVTLPCAASLSLLLRLLQRFRLPPHPQQPQ